jgi:hypothetical protein
LLIQKQENPKNVYPSTQSFYNPFLPYL